MKTLTTGTVLATSFMGITAALAGGSSSDVALFGKDPGNGQAFACYTRHYDAVHLAAHSKQNVADITLFVNSYIDSDDGRQYSLEIGVTFSATEKRFQVSGACGSSIDDKEALSCGIDCDGGQIDVSVKDANAVMVAIPNGARTWEPDAEDDTPPPENARFGEDDKLFRLDRTDLATCLPLVSDEDLKAAITATQ